MNARRIFKTVSLIIILAIAAWLLRPIGHSGGGAETPAAGVAGVKHVIRFSPGYSYTPGMAPEGIGSPLKALAEVIADYEKLHPDTRVDLVTAPVAVREYLVTQLSSGMAPEIINVNVEDVWQDVQKGWYVPLDPYLEAPNPYAKPGAPGSRAWWDMFKYQAISRGKRAPDGLNYCVSYDMIETGLFYNKNIFKEVGVEPPKDFEDFMRVCKKIQDYQQGKYIPVLMSQGSMTDWCVDLFFDQIYRQITPAIDLSAGKDPVREQYLKHYLDWDEVCFLHKQGFFSKADPRWLEVWRIMRRFRQYANHNLISVDPIREFVTGAGAMFWTSSNFSYRLLADKQLGFEWGVFYMPAFTPQTSKYADGHPMCVIGGSGTQYEITNSAISDTGKIETSEHLKRCVDFLEYLTAPEPYARIVNETPRLVPNIVGVPVPPILKPFADFLERDYTTTKWLFTFDLRYSEIFQRMLINYLNEGITLDEYLQWMQTSMDQATESIEERKPPDYKELQRCWDARAAIRATIKDLPNEAITK